MTYLDETLAAARELARCSRWPRALSLLDAAAPDDPARTALAAAEVALDSDWFAGTALAADRLATAEKHSGNSWDLDFLRLRHDYLGLLRGSGRLEFGPAGKDPAALDHLRDQARDLAGQAPTPSGRAGPGCTSASSSTTCSPTATRPRTTTRPP
jgi:hypothetical protein